MEVFHESISCFIKWPWNWISLNSLKEKFHSENVSKRSQDVDFLGLKNLTPLSLLGAPTHEDYHWILERLVAT